MKSETDKEAKLELIASKSFPYYEDMYKIIDYLNKNIKDKRLIVGLTKDKENGEATINIYEF